MFIKNESVLWDVTDVDGRRILSMTMTVSAYWTILQHDVIFSMLPLNNQRLET